MSASPLRRRLLVKELLKRPLLSPRESLESPSLEEVCLRRRCIQCHKRRMLQRIPPELRVLLLRSEEALLRSDTRTRKGLPRPSWSRLDARWPCEGRSPLRGEMKKERRGQSSPQRPGAFSSLSGVGDTFHLLMCSILKPSLCAGTLNASKAARNFTNFSDLNAASAVRCSEASEPSLSG